MSAHKIDDDTDDDLTVFVLTLMTFIQFVVSETISWYDDVSLTTTKWNNWIEWNRIVSNLHFIFQISLEYLYYTWRN